MTVVACATQDRNDFRRTAKIALHRRIRAIQGHELNRDERDAECEGTPFSDTSKLFHDLKSLLLYSICVMILTDYPGPRACMPGCHFRRATALDAVNSPATATATTIKFVMFIMFSSPFASCFSHRRFHCRLLIVP
jgi:hypothetical protein